jgi:formate hydrogenlyase subunit 4
MSAAALLSQLLQVAIALLLAPLLVGWVNQCRAWLQNKRPPSLFLPYRTIHKLFVKDAVIADNASPIFRLTPYIVFGAMCCAAAIVPSLATALPFARAADAIALVGLVALARLFALSRRRADLVGNRFRKACHADRYKIRRPARRAQFRR